MNETETTNIAVNGDDGGGGGVDNNAKPSTSPTASLTRPNPRSCVTCRRRKVRCNKLQPCSNCVKAKIECVFPSPGRAPRKSKKPRDSELLARLRSLESIVQNLNGTTDTDHTSPDHAAITPPTTTTITSTTPTNSNNINSNNINPTNAANGENPDLDTNSAPCPSIENDFGQLMIGDGKSRYVSHRFWTTFGDTIEELKNILEPSSSDEEECFEETTDDTPYGTSHDGFLFGFLSLSQSLREFHPSTAKRCVIWDLFCENVAPVVPIFHRPTLKKVLDHAVINMDTLNKNTEVMMFAVYYTAIATMTQTECLSRLGESRDDALTRYRFAFEQALGRANILNSQSFTLLQGLVLFLLCVRQQDNSRYVWSMTSIAYRIAQGLGLHRDGQTFGLSPFETEMRRRLWWHICTLDLRAAEDYGCDPFIHDAFYDTRFPLNINDDDISPDTKEPPEDRDGISEMSFFLIRCEVILIARRLSFVPASTQCRQFVASHTIKDVESTIENLNKRLETRYVMYCDMNIPIHWVCATVARLIIAKLWLMVHRPMVRPSLETALAKETHSRLLVTCIEIIEFSRLLETNSNTSKWSWLFRTHMQWHPVAFLLSELCVRPMCPGTERAWRAINSVYEPWGFQDEGKRGMLWPAIRKLMARAIKFRNKQLHDRAFGGSLPAENSPCGLLPANLYPQQTTPSAGSDTSYLPSPSQPVANSFDYPILDQNIETGGSYTINTVPSDKWSNLYNAMDYTPLDPNAFSNNAFAESPEWSEWDRLVREFQTDVVQGSGQDAEMTLPPDWFE
ncbi:hypothetical protein FQN57_005895 [Myotisia sp. PD_48]|nr:hypothetical protein FQN57_005895 [Myotisia sp. PD_48]